MSQPSPLRFSWSGFFRAVTTAFTRAAVITGLVWLVVNGVLDIIVLIGFLGMAPLGYITRIGLRYLMVPVMVIAAGIIADDAAPRHKFQYYPRGPILAGVFCNHICFNPKKSPGKQT